MRRICAAKIKSNVCFGNDFNVPPITPASSVFQLKPMAKRKVDALALPMAGEYVFSG